MSGIFYAATFITALGCGLVAGIFFAFSSFVMPALGRLDPAAGISAMQSINRLAVTPAFMTTLFGTAAACLGLVVWTLLFDGRPSALVLLGAGLYVVGTIVVTIAFNVPLNDALANANPQSPEAKRLWDEYLTKWTAWNHARTVAAFAAAAMLTLALRA